MLAANPDGVCQAVEHRLAAVRTGRQGSEALFKFRIVEIPVDHPGTRQRHRSLSGCEKAVRTELPRVASWHDEALLHPIGDPLQRFGQLRIIIVEPLRPGAVMKLKTVGHSKMAPLDLTETVGSAVNQQAILLDLLGIEVRRQTIVAGFIDGKLCDQLAKGSAILGIPCQIFQFLGIHARLGQHLLVVDERNGVPILGQSELFSVSTPEFVKTSKIIARGNIVLFDQRGDVDQQVVGGELRIPGEMVHKDVRCGTRHEARAKRCPIVSPGGLRHLDFDIGVGLFECRRGGLIRRQLGGIPEPIGDLGGGVRGGGSQRKGCEQEFFEAIHGLGFSICFGLLFTATELERLDHLPAEEDQQSDHGDHSENRARHETRPVGRTRLLLRAKSVDGDRDHPDAFFAPDEEWPEELVPGAHRDQDRQRGQRSLMHR